MNCKGTTIKWIFSFIDLIISSYTYYNKVIGKKPY